jgi:hypothetical protein
MSDEVKELKEVVKAKLGELYLPEFDAKLGDEKVLLDAKNFVNLSKLEKANGIIKSLNDQILENEKTLQETIAQRDKDLAKLKKAAEGNPELIKSFEDQIAANKADNETLKTQKDALEQKRIEDKKHYALIEGLSGFEVHELEHRRLLALDIKTKLGMDKLELDEKEQIKNIAEIVKPYQENKLYDGFFGKTIVEGNEHHNGGDVELGEWVNKNPYDKKTLNLSEQIRLEREDKTLADKLKKTAN